MRSRTLEKLLYKAAVLLVIIGAFVKFILSPATNLGLYFILAGHVAGVAGILMYMKYANDLDRQHQAPEENLKQLKKN
ncbi:hypothetical protein [uncultured Pontibacter sp.]|uniref:hypothetical protein n=1 Tax=uncultured Pontibacter sp. TaxID=453356 RepID=UPI0026272569|nr:hypothetical protein [uncultured Pontibacter sp.]